MRWFPFLFRLLFLHSDSLLLGTKFSPTQTREVSTMLGERRVCLNKAGWAGWIHRWVPKCLVYFFFVAQHQSIHLGSLQPIVWRWRWILWWRWRWVANRDPVGLRIWSIAYTSPLRTSIKERPPSSP
jgi:hypothetical protein